MNGAQQSVESQQTSDEQRGEAEKGIGNGITTNCLLDEVEAFDASAVESILERYRMRLKQIVSQQFDPRIQSRVDASDVVQEVMFEAARKLPEYAHERPVNFHAWLTAIAKQQLAHQRVHHLHRTKRSVLRERSTEASNQKDSRRSTLVDTLADPGDCPDRQAIHHEVEGLLFAALDQLPRHEKEVVFLRFFERLPARQIAKALSLSESAVRMRQLRAIQHLKKLLHLAITE